MLETATAPLVAQSASFALRLGATLVLARLLTPTDHGIYAAAAAIAAGLALFKDMGLGAAAVQRPDLSPAQAGTLFWINAAIGVALSAVAALVISPLAGQVFGEPRVAQACLGLAVVPLLDGLAAQPIAALKRGLRLGVVAAVDVAAVLTGVAVAILAARAGAGFWALVAMHASINAMTAAAAGIASGLRPGLPSRGHDLRPLFGFGSHVTLLALSSYATRNADTMMIGAALGPRLLGFYDKAYQLMMVPAQLVTFPLGSVAVPELSRLQADAGAFRRRFRQLARLQSTLALPVVAFLAVAADRLIPFLLGPQWTATVPLARALAAAAFFDAMAASAGWVFMAVGRAGPQVGFGLVASSLTILALACSLPWGILAVAWTFSACRALLCVPALVWACRETPVSWRDPLLLALPPALASAVAAAACHVLGWPDRSWPTLPALAAQGVLFVAVYAALCLGLGAALRRGD